MIRRLRIKFVCINMAIVLVMLCAIVATIFLLTRRNLATASVDFMKEVAAKPLENWGPALRGDDGQGSHLRLPFWVLEVDREGEIRLVRGQQEEEDDLFALARLAQEKGGDTGILSDYHLRYCRIPDGGGQRVVLVDISSETSAIQNIMRNCLVIAGISLAAFFCISVALAHWAVRPVEEAWREQRRFVADASHELKTPLTVILANAEMMESSGCQGVQTAQRVEHIAEESRQMRNLVEQLLELARTDSGIPRQQMEKTDLSRIVTMGVLPFEAVLYESGHPLETSVSEGILVKGSLRHLKEILEILLDNASKYARPGGAVSVSLQREEKGRCCLLRVSNEGEPLSREQCKKVFQRFYRADAARTDSGSYGLGLAIAAGIVREHGGRIWAESGGGKNTFCIRLPLWQGRTKK